MSWPAADLSLVVETIYHVNKTIYKRVGCDHEYL